MYQTPVAQTHMYNVTRTAAAVLSNTVLNCRWAGVHSQAPTQSTGLATKTLYKTIFANSAQAFVALEQGFDQAADLHQDAFARAVRYGFCLSGSCALPTPVLKRTVVSR